MNSFSNIVAVPSAPTTANTGLIVYWRLPQTLINFDLLYDTWVGFGLDEKAHAPDRVRPKPALKRALDALFSGTRTLVRPLKRKGEWSIVEEVVTTDEHGKQHLEHGTTLEVRAQGAVLEFTPVDHPLATDVRDEWERQLNSWTSDDLSGWLVRRVNKYAQGFGLRPKGGDYYIPASRREEWQDVLDVVAIAVPDHKFFGLPAIESDEGTVEAVLEAVLYHVTSFSEDVASGLAAEGDGALGVRAWRTKQKNADTLLNKLESYETMLGDKLTRIVDQLDGLRADCATAEIMAGASDD